MTPLLLQESLDTQAAKKNAQDEAKKVTSLSGKPRHAAAVKKCAASNG